MLRPKRKEKITEFSLSKNYASVILLISLFGCGLLILLNHGLLAIAAYLTLWIISYGVIYAGTCRYCAYYGKSCPIPLEGSCVHKFFEKKETSFGYMQLAWATVAYALRIMLPVLVIFRYELYGWGITYFSLLALFWIVHLRFTGCPNCINVQCPLNPDYSLNPATRR